MWTVLIQCMLVGKAIRVYNALEEGIARDYQKVKALVLKAYDLIPEAYRLKFRNNNKHPSQSFVEFARVKENQFDDWIKSYQVVSFASLREMLPLEEFKKACSKELRVHLEEVKVVNVSNAAQLADEYVLTHRSGASGNKGGISGGPPPQSGFGNMGMPMSNTPNMYNNPGSGRQRTCFWCNKPGHFQNQCHARRRYLERNGQIPVSLISTSSNVCDKGEKPPIVSSSVHSTSLPGLKVYSGNYVVLGGFPNTVVSAPLVEVRLSFPGYDGVTELAVVDILPIHGIDGILGNDMLNREGRELFPILSVEAYPVSVTTRASAQGAELDNDDDLLLSSLEVDVERPGSVDEMNNPIVINDLKPDWDRSVFIKAQKAEFNFELGDINDLTRPRCGLINNILYRFSRPVSDDPSHFGVWKFLDKLAQYCWWPGMKLSVKRFVKECEVCQVIGKPNQIIPEAPLNPIPAIGEPFSELVVDVVGPLPKTKTGFEYILTIMDRASRFPEACLLRKITSEVVFEKQIEFFSRYGLPRVIQTDCGTNFTSKMFRGKCAELAIRHINSVPYHSESQGVVERFHQTFKSILKKNCYAHGSEWDKELSLVMFAIRNHPNASTGVAPFDLIFGHKVRGPLDIFCEAFGADQRWEIKVGEFVDDIRKRMVSAWKFARDNLGTAQNRMKAVYDRNSIACSFEPGEMVLVLIHNRLSAVTKLSEVNYEIEAPGSSRKCRIFHINRLKTYHGKNDVPSKVVPEPVAVAVEMPPKDSEDLLNQVSIRCTV
ncbi:uncharacterized protein [Palaemon carinicauda]|uniref:uncharacterized protein n=1 Tax=Palaemon carinicauda TaxID=392227 RepID=UPI0035B669C7